MLVPGLKDLSLSQITSARKVNCSALHDALCRCARDMLARYEKKQERSKKLEVKVQAVEILLHELCKVPKDSSVTCEIISSALERHAQVLQGYEHLLSAKGNNYALMQQTQCLRKDHVQASLLRYHELKYKILGPDSLLDAKQRDVIFVLAEKKGLTMKTLESLNTFLARAAWVLFLLSEAGLLEPDLCARVFEHEDYNVAAGALLSLNKHGLVRPDLSHMLDGVLKHECPCSAGCAMERLNAAGLLEPEFYDGVLKHKRPVTIAIALEQLKKADLLGQEFYAEVLKHKSPVIAAMALGQLKRADLLRQEFYAGVLEHEKPSEAARALVKLNKHKLDTADNCSAILNHNKPRDVSAAIVLLDFYHLLTGENRNEVLAQENPKLIARNLVNLTLS